LSKISGKLFDNELINKDWKMFLLFVSGDINPTVLIVSTIFSPSPKEGALPSQDLDCIKFFSFSLIDGYVSLVMDTEAQRQ
jgi:hypothetical protein